MLGRRAGPQQASTLRIHRQQRWASAVSPNSSAETPQQQLYLHCAHAQTLIVFAFSGISPRRPPLRSRNFAIASLETLHLCFVSGCHDFPAAIRPPTLECHKCATATSHACHSASPGLHQTTITYVRAQRSVDAWMYTLEASTAETWVRFSERGSRQWRGRPRRPLAASEINVRKASNGGVGAKISSFLALQIWRVTILECILGGNGLLC